MRRFVSMWIIAPLLIVLLPSGARGGAQTVCVEPHVYERADVNTGILQFSYAGRRTDPLTDAARQLSYLIQLDALFSQVKYRSIGVEHVLVPEDLRDKCPPDQVFDKMLSRVRCGKALIFMTGSLFEIGEEIYIQTNIRFTRRDKATVIEYPLPERGEDFICRARLPFESVSFAPRRLERSKIETIFSLYESSTIARESPDINSPKREGWDVDQPEFYYFVEGTEGEWMKIRNQSDNSVGWVRADLDSYFGELRRGIPELDFMEGIAGFLRLASAPELAPENRRVIARHAAAAFRRYEERADRVRDAVPLATAKAASGMMMVWNQGLADASRHVGDVFTDAYALVPYSADARNLQTVIELYRWISGPGDMSPKMIIDKMEATVSLAPSNEDALTNLATVYRYLEDFEAADLGIPREELEKKIDRVKRVRADVEKRKPPPR